MTQEDRDRIFTHCDQRTLDADGNQISFGSEYLYKITDGIVVPIGHDLRTTEWVVVWALKSHTYICARSKSLKLVIYGDNDVA